MKVLKANNGLINTLSYMIFKILAYIVAIISIPLLTGLFSVEDYGKLTYLESLIILGVSVGTLGLPQAYIRLYSEAKNKKELIKLNSTYIYLIIIVFVLINFIFAGLFCRILDLNNNLYIVLLVNVSMGIVFLQISTILRAENKMITHSSILGVKDILSFLLPLILIFYIDTSIYIYFASKALIVIIFCILVFLILKKNIYISSIDKHYFKSLINFGVPLLMVSLGSTLLNIGDRIIIENILGSYYLGIYSVSSKIAHSIQQVIIYPINMIIYPIYIRRWEDKGSKSTEEFLSKSLEKYIFIIIPIMIGGILLSDEIIILLSNSQYLRGSKVFVILLTGLLLYGCYYFVISGLFISKKTILIGFISIISALLNIVLSWIASKFFGIEGVALVTVLSYLLFLILGYYFASNFIKVKINIFKKIKFVFAGVLMAILVLLLPDIKNQYVNLLYKILIGAFIYFLLNIRYIKNFFREG